MKLSTLKVGFFGSGSFAEPILRRALSDIDNIFVVTKKEKPKGRGQKTSDSAFLTIAKLHNKPFFEVNSKADLVDLINEQKPDLIIVASFGIIFPKEALDLARHGAINVHPSALPKYRGSSPIAYPLLNQDTITAVTFMVMTEGLDEGPIIKAIPVGIDKEDDYRTLEKKLSETAANNLTQVANLFIRGELTPKNQAEGDVIISRKIEKEDGRIDWNQSSNEIDAKVKAFIVWPKAYTNWEGKKLTLLKTRPVADQVDLKGGTVFKDKNGAISVSTREGYLILSEVQVEGGKKMAALDFINGHPNFMGSVLK